MLTTERVLKNEVIIITNSGGRYYSKVSIPRGDCEYRYRFLFPLKVIPGHVMNHAFKNKCSSLVVAT